MSTDTTIEAAAPRTRGRRAAAASAAPALPAELEALLRRMRLPYLRAAAPGVIATAKAQRWDPDALAVEHDCTVVLLRCAQVSPEARGKVIDWRHEPRLSGE